jgi:hypothetical protein
MQQGLKSDTNEAKNIPPGEHNRCRVRGSGPVLSAGGRGQQPVVLSTPDREDDLPHFAAFFNAIRTGSDVPADIRVGATAALTAILGREAIYKSKLMTWEELGVQI